MDDENRLREVDWLISTSLTPDRATAGRVLASALADDVRVRSWRGTIETMALASLLAALGATVFLQRRAGETVNATVTIVGSGSSIVVQRADGTRWLFAGDDAPDSSQASYAIAVHSGGSK